ncbi:putative sugar epimerase YhfK [Halomonadaceae bacterium LMG 33818]
MRVLVIGAGGKIGQRIVSQLKANPRHTPVAQVRHMEQVESFLQQGIETRQVDLEDTVSALAKAMEGIDAIVFTAGSGGRTGYDKTLLIDLDGAIKSMEAAEQVNIKRYVMVSALRSNNREKWHTIQPYFAAKYYADKALMNSRLDYTILRPGTLTDDAGTGKVSIEFVEGGQTHITRDDVASFAVATLTAEHTIGKAIDLVQGDVPINQVLAHLL